VGEGGEGGRVVGGGGQGDGTMGRGGGGGGIVGGGGTVAPWEEEEGGRWHRVRRKGVG
jgi:hypothetical protein